MNIQDSIGLTAQVYAREKGLGLCLLRLRHTESTLLPLKLICRVAIKEHLVKIWNVNGCDVVQQLGLPSILEEYLVYGDDDTEEELQSEDADDSDSDKDDDESDDAENNS